MRVLHAVAFVDHRRAEVLQFGAAEVRGQILHEQRHFSRQHRHGARTEHEFFGEVCDALDHIAEVVVTGGPAELADFRIYVDEHRPLSAAHIVDYEVIDHPTETELVTLARTRFVEVDRLLAIGIRG